jgi:hypothetical protein
VLPTDIDAATFNFYHCIVEGYGPFEDWQNELNGLIRYNLNASGTVVGSQNINVVRRYSQIWLVGDVGVPKVTPWPNTFPSCGYNTEITVFQPEVGQGWVNGSPQKQAACRHPDQQAVESFCDGHVESWKWASLDADSDDIFAINSF